VRCHNVTVHSSMRRFWIHIVACFYWTIKQVSHVKKLRIVLEVAFFGIELELLFETNSGCHAALFSTASREQKQCLFHSPDRIHVLVLEFIVHSFTGRAPVYIDSKRNWPCKRDIGASLAVTVFMGWTSARTHKHTHTHTRTRGLTI
jgi:hypothetical protein